MQVAPNIANDNVCVYDGIQPDKLTEGRRPTSYILRYVLLLFLVDIQSLKGDKKIETSCARYGFAGLQHWTIWCRCSS